MIMNALRGHLSEFGIVAALGSANLAKIIEGSLATPDQSLIPHLVRVALLSLVHQINELATQIRSVEMVLLAWHRQSKVSRRLETIPGVGFITATALAAAVEDPSHFKNGRQFAAWLGLTPRANSSGGQERVGRISRIGDSNLRTLLVLGSTSVLHFARNRAGGNADWINGAACAVPSPPGFGGDGQQDGARRLGMAARTGDWDQVRGLHQGQRRLAIAKVAGHMETLESRIIAKALTIGGRPHVVRASRAAMNAAARWSETCV